MATQSAFPVPDSPARLEVIDAADQRVVRVRGHEIACYRRDDRASERVVATQLAETLPMDACDIASTFGMHAVTLSRYRRQVREGGGQALMPRKTGPKGPMKVTPHLIGRIEKLREEGLSYRAIAGRLQARGTRISHFTVAAVLRPRPVVAKPQDLPFEASAAASARLVAEAAGVVLATPCLEEPETTLAETAAVGMTVGESRPSRYAGAFLLFASLERLNLWGILESLGAAAGPSRRWGWAETVSAVVLCFALRFRSIEDSKNALREDLGVLLGRPRSPGLLTLRQKIAALAESVDAVALSRELFRRYLQLEPVWEGLYYVDGHFCPYYGEHPTPKGWDAKRRLATTGHTDAYVHDARGRALFFLSQPLNDSLARAIPALVSEIRQVHGAGPFTLVFDRGGYSANVFRLLREQGIGFITYLRGRKARRRYPEKRFRPGWFACEGNRHTYQLYEKRTRINRVGTIRTILFRGEDGQQIPVLTSLDDSFRSAKVVHCLRLRWRQENSFKYLTENYAIDQIIQYGADPEEVERRVANPRRKALKERIRMVSGQIQTLEAGLGRALDENAEHQRPTARGLKIAHAPLRRQLAIKRQVLARLENRLRHTPAKIEAAVEKPRSLLREDRRLVVNALKLVAHNAERMLARRFNKHYARSQDAFSVFRALLHLPGEVCLLDSTHLEVCLDRPDSAKVADALAALLEEVNQERPRLPAGGALLSFTLRD